MSQAKYRRAEGGDGGQMTESLVESKDQEEAPKQPEYPGCMGPFRWFMANPFQRWPFALFLIFAGLTFLWLIMFFVDSYATLGYILAGISAIVMSAYGANHFRLQLALRAEVQKHANLNREFYEQNKLLREDVGKLRRTQEQLTGLESDLRANKERLKENLGRFRQLDENLKKLNVQNIEGLQRVQKSSEAVMDRWKQSLEGHERGIFARVRRQMQFHDDKEGLSKEEFEEFLEALPPDYQRQFQRLNKTFEDLAGDDGNMDIDEFDAMADMWIKTVADKGGSN